MKALEGDVRLTLATLRRHTNRLESPLYRLPPELVPEVASHLPSDTDLVNATHVSYHLRTVFLSHPSLWSDLNLEHEMRARAFFERSGQTTLHVDMDRDNTWALGTLTELRQQSKRIATLKLRHWPVQKKFLSEPLPSLRRLQIFLEPYDEDDSLEEDWDVIWAPVWGPKETATSWSFPSLTSLIVYNLNPIPFYTPHLTRFKFWDEEGIVNTAKLVSFLDNCPLLEHVDILSAGGNQSDDLAVSLPNLRTYTQTTFGEVWPITVLNMLSLPPFCSVTLRFRGYDQTTAEADDLLPNFKNPDYLAEIKRVKLTTAHDADGNEMVGMLELINTRGTKVCSERISFEEDHQQLAQGGKNRSHNVAHLNLFRSLDGRSVETLCIDGCASQDEPTLTFLKEGLGLGNVRTLILSHDAVWPCLSALDEHLKALGASCRSPCLLPIHTLFICPQRDLYYVRDTVLQPLLSIARKKKASGSPFRSVFLFLCGLGRGWDKVLKKLRMCVGELKVSVGECVLDWDVDKYFLDGLDHLQNCRDVEWD